MDPQVTPLLMNDSGWTLIGFPFVLPWWPSGTRSSHARGDKTMPSDSSSCSPWVSHELFIGRGTAAIIQSIRFRLMNVRPLISFQKRVTREALEFLEGYQKRRSSKIPQWTLRVPWRSLVSLRESTGEIQVTQFFRVLSHSE